MGAGGELPVSTLVLTELTHHTSWLFYSLLHSGAQEAIDEYFNDIGGRPEYNSTAPRKRGRQSLGTPASKATPKRARTTVSKKNGAAESEEDSKWTPPAGKSWEEEVTIIDTIERDPEGELVCYVQWRDGNKSQHPIKDIYRKCPQRVYSLLGFDHGVLVANAHTDVAFLRTAPRF